MSEILNILGSVGFNWHVALANFFNFLIILFLLNKFFFKKIGQTIDTRHSIIERGLNQAKDAEKALAEAGEEKNAILKEARKERDTIVANGESLARDLALKIEHDAQASIDARTAKLASQEAHLTAEVEKAFAVKAPHLVAQLYAKTLMRELTEEDNNKLIASMKA
jgi:F-type H+-transporting ATPase subunit b